MKSPSNHSLSYLAIAGLVLLSASPAWAVFPFAWATDGSGNPSNGSWTGNGTVQPNLNPASTAAQIAVQNFSSGTFLINELSGNFIRPANPLGRIWQNPSASHTITLTGGTADLRLHNSNNFDGGGSFFNSVGLTDFQGVTEISWTIRFSEPIAGRNDTLASLTTRPMGAGLALITAGSGQTTSSFTVGMQYNDIFSAPTNDGQFSAGVPTGATPYQSAGFNASSPGATSFTSDAFTGLDQFLLVRGYDYDGTGGYTAANAELVYISEMTWTIRRDDNQALASNTLFTMSMDGQQYANIDAVIPEPTSVLLISSSLLGACLIRRRRDQKML